MQRYYSLFGLLFFFTACLAQQNSWSAQPGIGAYYLPLRMERYAIDNGERYFENTLNLSASVPLSAKWRVGGQYMRIANKVVREPVDRAFMAGFFGRFNAIAQHRVAVYVEGGYTLGNQCPCGDAEGFRADTLNHFYQLGVGIDLPINRTWHLKAGFTNYRPISRSPDIYNWTQPYIGINAYFGRNYRVPFRVKFRKPKRSITTQPHRSGSGIHVIENEKKRRWNIGLSSAGTAGSLINNNPDQPNLRFHEFILVPRFNYYINQALSVGIQATHYRYRDDIQGGPSFASGWGAGIQFRCHVLSLKEPSVARAIRLDPDGVLTLSPTVGVEARVANYTWQNPAQAGLAWDYFTVQPVLGFNLSFQQRLSLFLQMGPTLGWSSGDKLSPVDGNGMVGFEYDF